MERGGLWACSVIKTFKTEEEAIELANDTHYGLAGAILSKDLELCERITKVSLFLSLCDVFLKYCWYRHELRIFFCTSVSLGWDSMGELFTTMFLPSTLGWNKMERLNLGSWGLENYLSVKQVTKYISGHPWGWYPSPSKL
ncbi:unnamed protein product [Victoria cruziana]